MQERQRLLGGVHRHPDGVLGQGDLGLVGVRREHGAADRGVLGQGAGCGQLGQRRAATVAAHDVVDACLVRPGDDERLQEAVRGDGGDQLGVRLVVGQRPHRLGAGLQAVQGHVDAPMKDVGHVLSLVAAPFR